MQKVFSSPAAALHGLVSDGITLASGALDSAVSPRTLS
jgi:hypothetical protein